MCTTEGVLDRAIETMSEHGAFIVLYEKYAHSEHTDNVAEFTQSHSVPLWLGKSITRPRQFTKTNRLS